MTTGELTPSTTGASAFPEVDAALRDLEQGEAAWARASLGDRADLLAPGRAGGAVYAGQKGERQHGEDNRCDDPLDQAEAGLVA